MINIGKIIYSSLNDLVNGRCYPIVADQGTTFPFIVYRRDSAIPQDSKDLFVYELVHHVEVKIVTETYDEGIELAQQVFDICTHLDQTVDEIKIGDSCVLSSSEDYLNDAYVQTLNIELKVIR